MRVGNKLLQKHDLTSDNEEQPKTTSKRFTKADTKFYYEKYTSKIMHGYFNRTIEKDGKIDHNNSKSWTKKPKIDIPFQRL